MEVAERPVSRAIAPSAAGGSSGTSYQRHCPEETTLYQTLREHWRTFVSDLEEEGAHLPRFVTEEVDAFLRCGILAHGFLRVFCDDCRQARVLAFSCKRRGFCPSCFGRRMSERGAHLVDNVLPWVPIRQWVLTVPHGLRFAMAHDPALTRVVHKIFVRSVSQWLRRRARRQGIAGTLKTGAVTVIQRFDSALGLNIHFHTLFFDGLYALDHRGSLQFHPTAAPTNQEVASVAERIFRKVHRMLEDKGDVHQEGDSVLQALSTASIQRRVAIGPRRGFPLRRLIGDRPPAARVLGRRCAEVEGFNLHANTRVAANERARLENLCRYVARPPLSDQRLEKGPDGNLTLRLKRPWSDGTTCVIFSPTELIEKLIPLIPRPRCHLTLYSGVLAPAAGWREFVVPEPAENKQKRPLTASSEHNDGNPARIEGHRRRWIPWADLLHRVFLVDALDCPRCHGRMRVVAAVMEAGAVRRILEHLRLPSSAPPLAPARAPPSERCDPDQHPLPLDS